MDTLSHWIATLIHAAGQAPPPLLFLAMALLPLLGLPISPFWVAAGIRLGVFWGTVLAAAALIVNFTIGYLLARTFLSNPIRRFLARRGHTIPQFTPGEQTQLILMVRITPGVPLFIQNYLLGTAGVSFLRYLLASIPAQLAYAAAFIWVGNSLSSNRTWRILLAISAFAAIAIAINLLRRRLKTKLNNPALKN
jgi:uncharacterized membrane protein YdjX (TVP38/TMEM64 family)